MNFYIEPGDEAAVSKAFKKCGELMTTGKHPELALVVPQLANLEGMISHCLGDDFVKALAKRKVVDLHTVQIRLFTKRQPPRFFKGPLVLAFTPNEQLKSVIKDNPGCDIVFIPWAPVERDYFVKNCNPELI